MQPDSPQDLPTALGHGQPVMNDERESAQTLRLGKASIGTRANKIEDLAIHHEILASHQESGMASVSLRLDDDVAARLQQLAELTSRSKTFYMVEAVHRHIDDLEDLYLAEKSLIELRASRSQTVPLEEVMKRYGMES